MLIVLILLLDIITCMNEQSCWKICLCSWDTFSDVWWHILSSVGSTKLSIAPPIKPVSFADMRAKFAQQAVMEPEDTGPRELRDDEIFPAQVELR